MFGQEVPESLINKGFPRLLLGFNSCRPHQNRVIMQKQRINARFFCIFDRFMRSKSCFFDKNPCFWRPFWRPHLNIVSPYSKSSSSIFLEELFCLFFKIPISSIPSCYIEFILLQLSQKHLATKSFTLIAYVLLNCIKNF